MLRKLKEVVFLMLAVLVVATLACAGSDKSPGAVREAAEKGDVEAQHSLGLAFFTGQGVPRDYFLAHMWSSVASTRGDKDASELRDEVAQRMTPDQLGRAQQLACDWKPKLEKMC